MQNACILHVFCITVHVLRGTRGTTKAAASLRMQSMNCTVAIPFQTPPSSTLTARNIPSHQPEGLLQPKLPFRLLLVVFISPGVTTHHSCGLVPGLLHDLVIGGPVGGGLSDETRP